ncbi:MAG: LPS export ABC transporter periplasmic protein LptC [Methyloprofundus sp.]|nr:LPS export ABC transporter periplasmic protein LptC [Methyloprofundus sp.]
MFSQQYKGAILLFLVFLFSMWVVNNEPEQALGQDSMQTEHRADHFAQSYRKITMNQTGQPTNKLYADFAAHYNDHAETELTNPLLTINKGALPPWVIRSKTGVIADDGRTIFMQGLVYIDRAGAKNIREVNIKTSNLRIQPKENYAETDDWAELVSDLDTISGVGMKLFYQDPLYIELLANVKGTHVYK